MRTPFTWSVEGVVSAEAHVDFDIVEVGGDGLEIVCYDYYRADHACRPELKGKLEKVAGILRFARLVARVQIRYIATEVWRDGSLV